MPKLTQNFNVSPYFDDFSENNEFYKILFRPGFSVQARELNQLQSMLQYQIDQLGEFNFVEGTRVFGGNLIFNVNVNSLTLKVDYLEEEIDVTNFSGRTIQGQTSGAKAEVVAAEIYNTTENNVIMINYFGEELFLDGEVINTIDSGPIYHGVVTDATDGIIFSETLVTSLSSKEGSVCSISEGVFYRGGYFLYIPAQTIILEKFSKLPTSRIGLEVKEEIITSVEDDSLLDNALGFPNYAAPGANRYKISLTLVKKDLFEAGRKIIPSGVTFTVDEKDYRSGQINVTTASDHNLSLGDTIVLTGALETEVNGKYVVTTIPSSVSFGFKIQGKPKSPVIGDLEYIRGIVDPIERNVTSNFIEMLRVENGEKVEERVYPLLNDIEKTFARRTFDINGDFTVRPFPLDVLQHKISGVASPRTLQNTFNGFEGTGTNFVRDLNQGDVIFLSGNPSNTATVGTITNTSYLLLSTGKSLGNGTDFQKIGVESKLTLELGPGKAYVKGFEHETITTTNLSLNKARDIRSVQTEQQGLEFGPYVRATDYFANNVLDTGINTADGDGSGMDIVDLHMVKWPSTSRTDGTTNLITNDADDAISFVGIDTLSTDDINRTKIGTARIRQIDHHGGRSVSVDSKYSTDSTNRTYHRLYPGIFNIHLFDFRFSKKEGTVSASNSNVNQITLDNYYVTPNCLYGTTITVNTSFLGVTTTDTRKIISYTGDSVNGDPNIQYTAVLDSPLTQPTQSDSTYSINYSVKDIRSGVKLKDTGGGLSDIVSGFNIDVSGKTTLTDEGDTVLFDNNDDQRTLLFPFNNKAVASTSGRKYKFKRTFLEPLTGNTASFSTPFGSQEKFYPGTISDLTLSDSQAEANYVVTILDPDGNQTGVEGDYVEFSNTSGSGLSSGRSIKTTLAGQQLTINVQSTHSSSIDFNYEDKYIHVVATMMTEDGDVGSEIGKKILVTGNTQGALIDSVSSTSTPNLLQAQQGQLAFGPGELDYTPGAVNSLKLADVNRIITIVDSKSVNQNVSNVMVAAAISSQITGTPSIYNVTNDFIFDNGQKDNYYDYATIRLKNNAPKPTGQILVILEYYLHEGFGPFTVDSYIFPGSGNTPYQSIPTFTSPVTGKKTFLRDSIDFRPKRKGIETADSFGLSDTNDILTSNVFSEKCMPDYDFAFECLYSHYLPRKDKVVLGRDRQFKIIEGISDLDPVLPPDDEDSLTLYSLELEPYTSLISDVQVRYIDNRRYTMRDIGKLERRIETLEYYTALSLMEKEADSLVITDSNNNDRFKNGILVDPFQGHNIGDVLNLDYACSIDFDAKKLRPSFSSDAYKFDIDQEPTTLVNNAGLLTLPFIKAPLVSQLTTGSRDGVNIQKTIKIHGGIVSYMGTMSLDPPSDIWYDTDRKVTVKVNTEGQYNNWEKIEYKNGHGSQWNDWEDFWSGKQINNDTKSGIIDLGKPTESDRSTLTTSQQQTLTGLTTGNIPEQIIKTFGNKILNISVTPKVREQKITFVAQGLRPNKSVYAFFGDSRVTGFIKQASIFTLRNVDTDNVFRVTPNNFEKLQIVDQPGSEAEAGNTATVVYMTDRNSINSCSIMVTNMTNQGAFRIGQIIRGVDNGCEGIIENVQNFEMTDQILTVNQDGVTAGEFYVPNVFDPNDILFRVCDDSENIPELTTSVAERMFYSKGVLDNKNENNVISVRPLNIRRHDINSELIIKDVLDSTQSGTLNFYYPLAQTFFVNEELYPKGLFLERIVLFFRSKDQTVGAKPPVILQLRPMINGKPSPSMVIPGSEVVLTPGKVTANTSTPTPVSTALSSSLSFPEQELGNSLTANKNGLDIGSKTVFKFDHPVYVTPGEYAITIISNSDSYELYGFDVNAKLTGSNPNNSLVVQKNNFVGSIFLPTNTGLYEANKNSGLMFEVYHCEFSELSGLANFKNLNISQNGLPELEPDEIAPNELKYQYDTFKLMTDTMEFTDTFVDFKHSLTEKDGTERNPEIRFTPNKSINLLTQKEITYTTDETDDLYQNSLMINLYFETTNTKLSPVIDTTRLGFITVENSLNNGELSNTNILLTDAGSGYDTDAHANTNVFVVSEPDLGSDRATLAAKINPNGTVAEVYVVNPGSGYVTTPTITLYDGGNPGVVSDNVASTTSMVVKINGEGAKANGMMTANKEHSFGGNLLSRYISKRVTLEEGFDARDLRVYLNAYKPRGSNIHVYYKVLSDSDPETFDEKPYIAMIQDTADSTFSLNEDDTRNFVFRTQDQYISYTNDEGTIFDNFRTFAIKIAFTLNRDAQTTFIGIPKVLDMKAIALDSVGVP